MKPISLVLLLSCLSCAHVTPLEGNLLKCGEQAVGASVTAELPAIEAALASQSPTWQLAPIFAAASQGTICAVLAIYNSLTQPAADGGPPADLTAEAQRKLVRVSGLLHNWGVVRSDGVARYGAVPAVR